MFLSVSLGFSGFLWVPRVWAFLGSRSDTLYLQTTYTFRRSSYGMLTSQLWLYTIPRRQTIVFVSSTLTPSHSSLTPSWIEIQTLTAFRFSGLCTFFLVIITVNGCFYSGHPRTFLWDQISPVSSSIPCCPHLYSHFLPYAPSTTSPFDGLNVCASFSRSQGFKINMCVIIKPPITAV